MVPRWPRAPRAFSWPKYLVDRIPSGSAQAAAYRTTRVSGGDVNPYLECGRRAGGRLMNGIEDGAEPPAPIQPATPNAAPNCRNSGRLEIRDRCLRELGKR